MYTYIYLAQLKVDTKFIKLHTHILSYHLASSIFHLYNSPITQRKLTSFFMYGAHEYL